MAQQRTRLDTNNAFTALLISKPPSRASNSAAILRSASVKPVASAIVDLMDDLARECCVWIHPGDVGG